MFNSEWYLSLNKPYLSPPSWVFTPVWSVLYILMFLSLGLFIIKDTKESKIRGYTYFTIQIFLNFLWSPAFFLQQNIGLAFLIIILLDFYAFLTVKEFYKASKPSAYLLIPYLVWIIFATYLNGAYLYLN